MDESQFNSQVFPAELEEIQSRREAGHPQQATAPLRNETSTQNNLIGLACSGGGIRSASFSLGVIQYLIANKLFGAIDYLSTVSGGGYTGSCISALAKDDAKAVNLLTQRSQQQEPAALNHLRNYSEYLRASGLLNGLRLPVLFIEGILRSILIFLPLVIFATFITEAIFELAGRVSPAYQWITPLVGVLPLVTALTLRPIIKEKLQWSGRDKADARLTLYAGLAAVSLLAVPTFAGLAQIVHLDSASLFESINHWLYTNRVIVGSAGGLLIALLIASSVRWRAKVLIPLAGFLAPAALISLYVILCVEAIDSPYTYHPASLSPTSESKQSAEEFTYLQGNIWESKDISYPMDCSAVDTRMCQSLNDILNKKGIDVSHYQVKTHNANELILKRIKPAENAETGFLQSLLAYIPGLSTHTPNTINIKTVPEIGSDRKIIEIEQLKLFEGYSAWWLYILGLLIQLYNWMFININHFSLHPFYRDRLSRTFLITPNNGTLEAADTLKLSELRAPTSSAPYHIINAALNLQGSDNPQLRTRKTAPFILTKRFCGSPLTGYCDTRAMEQADPHFNLAAAMAISAAAASPNMGTATVKPLSFLLTLLNVRLNYWLPNPGLLAQNAGRYRVKPLGISYLVREALGFLTETTPYVNCSDGGHIENLAVYELLRRQCKTIICIDAEADPTFSFAGLVTLQRYAAIDLGAVIDIDVTAIRPVNGLSASNHTEGVITYTNGELGRFIYLKLSFTGREPEYLRHYRQQHPDYPHQPTSDQYFDETQFEVYRALGSHVAESAGKTLKALAKPVEAQYSSEPEASAV